MLIEGPGIPGGKEMISLCWKVGRKWEGNEERRHYLWSVVQQEDPRHEGVTGAEKGRRCEQGKNKGRAPQTTCWPASEAPWRGCEGYLGREGFPESQDLLGTQGLGKDQHW